MAGSKRRSTWGSITYDPKARVGRIRYWAKDSDGIYRRMSKTVHGSMKDVEHARSELMVAHDSERPCPTVGFVWETWALPTFERRVEDGDMARQTVTQYMSGWRRHAAPRWGDVPCDHVRPLDVQTWLDGMGHNEALSALKVLKPTMDIAVRYEVTQSNPFRERYLLPSKSGVQTRDKGVWTLDELGEVWRSVYGSWIEPAFLLSAFGGLRVGEALGVRGEDVVPGEASIVQVRRQISNRGAKPTERLKTSQSRRDVPVPGRAGERIAELAAGGGWLTNDGLGNPQNRYRLGRAWDSLVPDNLRHPFRNLRNSYETNMRWALRLHPWVVEPLLGHAGKEVTGVFYDRPSTEMLTRVVLEAYEEFRFDEGWDWVGAHVIDSGA